MHPKVLMLESVLSEYKLSALHRSLETVWSATEVLILLSAFYVTSCSNFISQKLIFFIKFFILSFETNLCLNDCILRRLDFNGNGRLG